MNAQCENKVLIVSAGYRLNVCVSYLIGEGDLYDEAYRTEDQKADLSTPGSAHLSWKEVDH